MGISAPERVFGACGRAFRHPGAHLGHAGWHFGARARVWARGRAFCCPGACLGKRAGILAPGRTFGHAAQSDFESDFESDFKSDFESNFESDFESVEFKP